MTILRLAKTIRTAREWQALIEATPKDESAQEYVIEIPRQFIPQLLQLNAVTDISRLD